MSALNVPRGFAIAQAILVCYDEVAKIQLPEGAKALVSVGATSTGKVEIHVIAFRKPVAKDKNHLMLCYREELQEALNELERFDQATRIRDLVHKMNQKIKKDWL